MERLCFGTFIDVLMQCKNRNIEKTQLTTAIIRTIDPDSKYDNTPNALRALNHLYKCTGDFTDTYSAIRKLAPKAKRTALVKNFENDVIPLIDTDKREQAILALCNIIKKDATLDYENGGENVKKFQNYIKKNILDTNEYILSEFLADIFRYTVIEIKNTDGKEWLEMICANHKKYEKYFEDYVNDFRDKRNTIRVWADAKQKKKEQPATHKDASISQNTQQKINTDTPSDSQSSDIDIQTDPQNTNQGSDLYIPPEYHSCFYCEYFSGIAKTVHKNITGARGTCSLHKRTTAPTDGANCDSFLPNYSKISLSSLIPDHGLLL